MVMVINDKIKSTSAVTISEATNNGINNSYDYHCSYNADYADIIVIKLLYLYL